MKKSEFQKIYELEESHWWYVGTREIAFSILEKIIQTNKITKIYDVGCGTGGNMAFMQKYGEVEGSDIDPSAVEFAKSKNLKSEIQNMNNINLEKHKYDLVTFFEVLSQAEESEMSNIIKKVSEGIKTGGYIMLREPAMKIAGGNHDIEINANKRFEIKDMSELLKNSGFEIKYISYMNSLLFIPIVLVRKVQTLFKLPIDSDVQIHNTFVNNIYLTILRIEKFLLKYIKFPFGVSILVIAQKIK